MFGGGEGTLSVSIVSILSSPLAAPQSVAARSDIALTIKERINKCTPH